MGLKEGSRGDSLDEATSNTRLAGQEFGQASALIIAHPGHELLLHHWLERARPTVFALTDGSGSRASDRRSTSRRIIQATGSHVGPSFGIASDRRWYDAILDGDDRLFLDAVRLIGEVCVDRRIARVVCDAVEFFNPMHDLCTAVAQAVTGMLAQHRGSAVELLDFAIERGEQRRDVPALALDLDEAALARKSAAANSYRELTEEVDRAHRIDHSESHAVERLFRVNFDAAWPEAPAEEPYYERFGRQRVAEGIYSRLITYRGHVRPLALAVACSQVPTAS